MNVVTYPYPKFLLICVSERAPGRVLWLRGIEITHHKNNDSNKPISNHFGNINIVASVYNIRAQATCPANTQRNKHMIIITPKRRFDVIITCLLRCEFTGCPGEAIVIPFLNEVCP